MIFRNCGVSELKESFVQVVLSPHSAMLSNLPSLLILVTLLSLSHSCLNSCLWPFDH